MWQSTEFTQKLNVKYPLIQAPMAGGATTPELIAAVSNAGGLGSLGAGYMPPEDIRKTIQNIRELTDKPFSINLFIPENHSATEDQIIAMGQKIEQACPELNIKIDPVHAPFAADFGQQMQVILEEKVPIFSFTFGILDDFWIKTLKKEGIYLIGTATTLTEALLLEQQQIDAIVAQGSEAGGHRGTFIGEAKDALIDIDTLTKQLRNTIGIPIISSGGIMEAKKIVSLLNSGAQAVQMGTVFLSCNESGINRCYKELLLNLEGDDSTLTSAFSGKLARGIYNKFIERMLKYQNDILDYPIQNAITRSMRKEADKQNNCDFMSLWAGQYAHLCKSGSAEDVIKRLVNELNQSFSHSA